MIVEIIAVLLPSISASKKAPNNPETIQIVNIKITSKNVLILIIKNMDDHHCLLKRWGINLKIRIPSINAAMKNCIIANMVIYSMALTADQSLKK
jgi:hypothetical protein